MLTGIHPPPPHTQYYSQIPVIQVRGYLESCRYDHDEQGGPLTTDGGEVIMEETEYQAVTQLKQVSMSLYTHFIMYVVHIHDKMNVKPLYSIEVS